MAEDILRSIHLELSSNNLDFEQNIFNEALFELNKEVESLSGKSIKDFVFECNNQCTVYTRNKL